MAVAERIIEAQPAARPPDSQITAQPWSEISTMPSEFQFDTPVPSLSISLMGTGGFGEQTYQRLKNQGHKINVVFAPPNPNDPLRQAVNADNETREEGNKIYLYDLSKEELGKPEAAANFADETTDLGVFASVTEIVGENIFNAPKYGTIGMHDSLLPEGRGGSAGNNALIKGKDTSGISIYQLDDGVDTGDILLQAKVALLKTDTPFSLFADTTPIGVDLLCNSVELIARQQDHVIRREQDRSIDTSEPLIRKSAVDWNQDSEKVYDYLRGSLNQGPYSELLPEEGVDLKEYLGNSHDIINFTDIAWLPDRKYQFFKPGTIVDINDAGMIVATKGGAVRIGRLQQSRLNKSEKSGKMIEAKKEKRGPRMKALDYALANGLSIGQMFVVPEQKPA